MSYILNKCHQIYLTSVDATNPLSNLPQLGAVCTMNIVPYGNSDTGRCNSCGRFFPRQSNLTKHQRDHCAAARRHSKDHWKRAGINLMKLDRTTLRKRPVVGPRLHDVTNISGANMEHGPVDIPNHLVCPSFLQPYKIDRFI